MSLLQDICYYVAVLGLSAGLCLDSATMNVRIQGCESVPHTYPKESGFVAIFPYFFSNKTYNASIIKVRFFYLLETFIINCH